MLLPFLAPAACAIVAVALYVLNISRVFLAGDTTPRSSSASIITLAILVGASLHLRQPAAAHVVAGDDHRRRARDRRVGAVCSSLGPSLEPRRGRGGRRLRRADGPATATSAPSPVEATQRRSSSTPTRTRPLPASSRSTSPGRPVTRCSFRDPEFDGFVLGTDAGGPRRRARSSWRPARTRSTATSPATSGRHAGDDRRHVSRQAPRGAPVARSRSRRLAARRRVGAAAAVTTVAARLRRAEGPADRDASTLEAGNFYFKPDKITADAGIAKIKLDSQGGIHDFVFDDGNVPGFQLEVDGGGGDRRQEDRPEAGKYDLLLHHHRPPRSGHGRHAHRRGRRPAAPSRAARRAPARDARAAGRRARRSPTARAAPTRVERSSDRLACRAASCTCG